MNHTKNYLEQQEAKRLQDRISSFLDDFKVGTLLAGSGIRSSGDSIFKLTPVGRFC